MRRLLRATAVLAALPLAVLPATVSHAAAPPPATYLALGDSLAFGVGASRPDLGYVPLVADALRSARQCGDAQTASCLRESINLSVDGATTTTLIADQLPAATALLRTRNSNTPPEDDVRLITLTVGGNDLFRPAIAACQNPTAPQCSTTVATQLQQVATNYPVILGQLRAAAGRDTTIAVTTYYNGLAAPGCPAAALTGLAQVVLEGGAGVPAGLNDIIRQTAQAFGAVVVETAPVIQPAEIRPDCLHPTDQGHADIAGAVTGAVLPSVIAGPTPTPAPVPAAITVDKTVIDVGQSHVLRVVGRADAQEVLLFGASAPSATFRQIRREFMKPEGAGSYMAWELKPGGTTRFYAVVDGVRTAVVEVRVRRTVTIGIRQPVRGVYTFSGTINRPDAGVQVTIGRLDSETKRVTGVASTRTTADGRYEIRTSLPAGLAGYYALTSATPQLDAGRSRLYGLLVNTRPGPGPAPATQSVSLDVGRGTGYFIFSGAVSPARSVPVTLARVVNGQLVGVAGGRAAASGGYVFRVPVGPGTHFFQVVTATARSRVYGLVVPAAAVPPPVVQSSTSSVSYANCTALRMTYRHGIGRVGAVDRTSGTPVTTWVADTAGYDRAIDANDDLDRDDDGIACERA